MSSEPNLRARITPQATWDVSDRHIATVSPSGLVTWPAPGRVALYGAYVAVDERDSVPVGQFRPSLSWCLMGRIGEKRFATDARTR